MVAACILLCCKWDTGAWCSCAGPASAHYQFHVRSQRLCDAWVCTHRCCCRQAAVGGRRKKHVPQALAGRPAYSGSGLWSSIWEIQIGLGSGSCMHTTLPSAQDGSFTGCVSTACKVHLGLAVCALKLRAVDPSHSPLQQLHCFVFLQQ